MLANTHAARRFPAIPGLRGSAAAAGMTATLIYLFGPVPMYLATASVFSTPAQLSGGCHRVTGSISGLRHRDFAAHP